MQYETCCHIHESGAYCGSPALQANKYCYYHLRHRGRRLRRARALRDKMPYRLEIPPLQDLDSIQFALSEITEALGDSQLDHRVAGKMLYAIQQATSLIKYRAKLQVAQAQTVNADDQVSGPPLPASGKSAANTGSCIREYPNFEREFGLNPGADIDAEMEQTLRKAEEQEELRHANDFPAPPPGMRIGSAQYRIYREECYQALNLQMNSLRHELREYHEEKRKQSKVEIEKLRKEALSAVSAPAQSAKTA